MPRIRPFRALTYAPSAGPLERLTARPYDVITEEYRTGYLAGSSANIVHIDLPEGSMDPADPGNRYDGAATLLARWRGEGILVLDPEPAYFAYEMRFPLDGKERRVRGLLCAVELEPWGDTVWPHELTMPGPLEDRLRLLRATRTHLSPIYGTVPGPDPRLDALLDEVSQDPPPFEVKDTEGVEHRMWRIDASESIDRWLDDQPLLIADGHHRYTTALAYRQERDRLEGPGPWDEILTLLVDSGTQDVPVLAYHRIQVAGSPPGGGEPATSLEEALGWISDPQLRYATITRGPNGEVRYGLHEATGEPPTVRALHEQLLDRIAPGDSLLFTHEATEADRAVRDGGATAAYLLPMTTPERIRRVVQRNERLPRKSTFFWPKPRTGMALMPLD